MYIFLSMFVFENFNEPVFYNPAWNIAQYRNLYFSTHKHEVGDSLLSSFLFAVEIMVCNGV